MTQTRLEIVSLNCWGLKYISKHTTERIQHIAEELSQLSCDIICLQEIWQEKHWHHIKSRLDKQLPFGKFYYSGMMGSGLAILSKFPIIQTDMRPYTLNGRPQAFFRGDWFVGKGVASAIIELPDGRKCQIFNTHMHAPYNEMIDTYLCHRTAQGWDLRKILQASVLAGYITFATGDFNSIPGSLVHRFLTTYLSDSFVTLYPDLPLLPEASTNYSVTELIDIYGMTCDISPLNTWRAQQAPSMEAKRLDYVFHDERATPESIDVIFTTPLKTLKCSPSDHFGLRCVYSLKDTSHHSRCVVNRKLHLDDYDEMLRVLQWYTARQNGQSTQRIWQFWLCLGCSFLLLAVIANMPSALARVTCALSIFLLGAVTVLEGLLGVVFGWWELRSLREFEDEILRARILHKDTCI